MLAASPNTFSTSRPAEKNTSTEPHASPSQHNLRQKNFLKNRRPMDFVETLGKFG
jgi:hypothetical protein